VEALPKRGEESERMNSVETIRLTSVTRLFIVTAVLEAGAGLMLLVVPAMVLRLLFGSVVELFPAASIARVAGAALLSLGAACWWARHDERSAASRALVGGLLVYNTAVGALVSVGVLGALGPLQWTAIVVHGALALWCIWIVADR
jgi:hypothetical protein